jgi:hypothetical protein
MDVIILPSIERIWIEKWSHNRRYVEYKKERTQASLEIRVLGGSNHGRIGINGSAGQMNVCVRYGSNVDLFGTKKLKVVCAHTQMQTPSSHRNSQFGSQSNNSTTTTKCVQFIVPEMNVVLTIPNIDGPEHSHLHADIEQLLHTYNTGGMDSSRCSQSQLKKPSNQESVGDEIDRENDKSLANCSTNNDNCVDPHTQQTTDKQQQQQQSQPQEEVSIVGRSKVSHSGMTKSPTKTSPTATAAANGPSAVACTHTKKHTPTKSPHKKKFKDYTNNTISTNNTNSTNNNNNNNKSSSSSSPQRAVIASKQITKLVQRKLNFGGVDVTNTDQADTNIGDEIGKVTTTIHPPHSQEFVSLTQPSLVGAALICTQTSALTQSVTHTQTQTQTQARYVYKPSKKNHVNTMAVGRPVSAPTSSSSTTSTGSNSSSSRHMPTSAHTPTHTPTHTQTHTLTSEQQQIVAACRAGHNVFISGGAGTGKSQLLEHIISALTHAHTSSSGNSQQPMMDRSCVFVCAPTGLAAVAIGGVTVHQFAGLPVFTPEDVCAHTQTHTQTHTQNTNLDVFVGKVLAKDVSGLATKRWKQAKLLIIDEVSMLSPLCLEVMHSCVCVCVCDWSHVHTFIMNVYVCVYAGVGRNGETHTWQRPADGRYPTHPLWRLLPTAACEQTHTSTHTHIHVCVHTTADSSTHTDTHTVFASVLFSIACVVHISVSTAQLRAHTHLPPTHRSCVCPHSVACAYRHTHARGRCVSADML